MHQDSWYTSEWGGGGRLDTTTVGDCLFFIVSLLFYWCRLEYNRSTFVQTAQQPAPSPHFRSRDGSAWLSALGLAIGGLLVQVPLSKALLAGLLPGAVEWLPPATYMC